jgi:hypothetical protein
MEILENETKVESTVTTLNNLLNEHSSFTTQFNYGERLYGLKVVEFTPEMCKYILEHHNSNNRDLKRRNVDHILNEIGNGNWAFNGETIGFDENGDLTNGQHRLTSISEGEVSLVIPTFTNLDPDVFKTIDTGQTRTPSDVLAIDGIENSSEASATVKFVNDIVNNCFNNTNKGRKHTLSNTDVLEYYSKLGEDKIQEAIEFFNNTKSRAGSPLGLQKKFVTGFHYVLTTINPEKGQEFMDKLMTGTNITEGCPIKLLREKLFTAKTSKSKKHQLTPTEKIKYVMFTWTKFIAGDETKRLLLPKVYNITTDFSLIPTRD